MDFLSHEMDITQELEMKGISLSEELLYKEIFDGFNTSVILASGRLKVILRSV